MEGLWILWLFAIIGVGWYANNKGRNPVLWGLLALFISPIIAGIILALSKDQKIEQKIEHIDRKTEIIRTDVDHSQKFSDYRAEQIEKGLNEVKRLQESILLGNNPISLKSNNQNIHSLPPTDRKVFCSGCGFEMRVEAKYCHQCGQMAPKPKPCPFCGKLSPSDAKYCQECGKEIIATISCKKCLKESAPGARYCTDCGSLVMA
jgi:hypothetical protein